MSEQPVTAAGLPKWDLADRMRKSLRHAGMTVQEMASYLDVGQNTVSTWINGRIDPSTQTMRLWSLRTGIPLSWFCHGNSEPCDTEPVTRPAGKRTPRGFADKMHCMPTNEVA